MNKNSWKEFPVTRLVKIIGIYFSLIIWKYHKTKNKAEKCGFQWDDIYFRCLYVAVFTIFSFNIKLSDLNAYTVEPQFAKSSHHFVSKTPYSKKCINYDYVKLTLKLTSN